MTEHSLESVRASLNDEIKPFQVWADHRASALAELVRGSFILCAVVGTVAVFGALIGLLIPTLATLGKIAEILCLALILWFIRRSKVFGWRRQWLSLRETERCLDQASWLLMLGRTRSYAAPPPLREVDFDGSARWCSAYLGAILRHASFPTARLSADYLSTVHRIALDNLVKDQLCYLKGEALSNRRSDEHLESWTNRSVWLAAAATAFYLVIHVVHHFVDLGARLQSVQTWLRVDLHSFNVVGAVAVAVLGALMPAVAAALSAIRHHGDYSQIAGRFLSTAASLQEVETQLAARLPDLNRGLLGPRSTVLTALLLRASDALVQEVQGWSAALRTKEIEPT